MANSEETRVRYGLKQTAKGAIQLDITTEASTVEQAERLMDDGIKRLRALVLKHNYRTVDMPEKPDARGG